VAKVRRTKRRTQQEARTGRARAGIHILVSSISGTMKIARHLVGFLKKIVKIDKNKKLTETSINRPVWPINRSILKKTGVATFGHFFVKTGRFLSKINKWNEKTIKNNGHDIY
jgi:hypothetical protein